MDLWDIVRYALMPVAVAMWGYQLKVDHGQNQRLNKLAESKLDESQVRQIIADKAEALHLADQASKDRLDRVEARMDAIDQKLDKIIELILK